MAKLYLLRDILRLWRHNFFSCMCDHVDAYFMVFSLASYFGYMSKLLFGHHISYEVQMCLLSGFSYWFLYRCFCGVLEPTNLKYWIDYLDIFLLLICGLIYLVDNVVKFLFANYMATWFNFTTGIGKLSIGLCSI